MIERRPYHVRIIVDALATPYEARRIALEIIRTTEQVERNPGQKLKGLA